MPPLPFLYMDGADNYSIGYCMIFSLAPLSSLTLLALACFVRHAVCSDCTSILSYCDLYLGSLNLWTVSLALLMLALFERQKSPARLCGKLEQPARQKLELEA